MAPATFLFWKEVLEALAALRSGIGGERYPE